MIYDSNWQGYDPCSCYPRRQKAGQISGLCPDFRGGKHILQNLTSKCVEFKSTFLKDQNRTFIAICCIYIYIHSKCVSIYNHILRQIRYHCVSASGAPRMEHGPQTSVERNIALLRDLAVLGEGPILKFQVISDRFCNKEWRTNITWITKWRGYSLFLRF